MKEITPDELPVINDEYIKKTEYTLSAPRRWTKEEEAFVLKKVSLGYSTEYIGELLGRTEVSVQIKYKRLKKANGSYNEKHLDRKYESNRKFIDMFEGNNIESILDVYAGTNRFWKTNYDDTICVTDNDKDINIPADSNHKAEVLMTCFYHQGKTYDIIDLDPYGSAIECFEYAIRMAQKGLIITYGEVGHIRWKRTDFVSKHYPSIQTIEDFTFDNIIKDTQDMAVKLGKILTPVIVASFKNILRVYYMVEEVK